MRRDSDHVARIEVPGAMYRILASAVTGLVLAVPGVAGEAPAPSVPPAAILEQTFGAADAAAFREPPRVFQPETWFHFIGGNIAKPGITADLEAIASAGIEGIQFFHGQFGGAWPGMTTQIKCLSEPWNDAVHHMAAECERLGLRFTMQNCPGWAMAGGPWITPDNAMRELVWSRADVTGGHTVEVVLPQPQPSREDWRDYRDIAVVAFPTPAGDTGKALIPVSVSSNREGLPWDKCLRKEAGGTIKLEPAAEPARIDVTFAEPVTLRTVELPSVQGFNHAWCYVPGVTVTVEAVTPNGDARDVAHHELPASNWQGDQPISLACSEATARTYRITIDNKHPMSLGYIQLYSAARHNNWRAEAACVLRALDRAPQPRQSPAAWVEPARVVALADRMDSNGRLHWDAPDGTWTILRWGHVNSGRRNGPAPPEATGWECNKLSPIGAETHFAGYIGRLAAKDGPVGSGRLRGMLLDSWECKTQTWTPGMDDEFAQRRGYALRPWMPALAGFVLGDPETTTRFLRDWRATINDLLVTNFFGRMAALGHADGLAISFETASGDVFPGDILEYYKHADIPMCEFWQPRSEAYVGSFDFKPVKPCVSAARMYGKPRVAAESFTSFNLTWNEHPAMLKAVADMHLAEGVTHLIFHTYTHNPRTDWLPPGTSFGSGIGTPFLRGQTWWPHMPEFTAYLARCGYLLERGRPVSDVLWYLGDEQDHKPSQAAPFPAGYRYDYCNPDVLLNRLSVRDGSLVTPEGLTYRVLWLRECPRMLPETLERLVALVNDGAVLVGEPPHGPATLVGGEQTGRRFAAAVAALWGRSNAPRGSRNVGRGRVISGLPLQDALHALQLEPDVQGEGVTWTHRKTDTADWYFVAAPAEHGFHGSLKFRAGGDVELWDPLTGASTPAGVLRQDAATSRVALELPPAGSIFVVFRRDRRAASSHVVRLERDGEVVTEVDAARATTSGPEIVSAAYGDPTDAGHRKNVIALVRRDLAAGATTVTGSNGWAGGDPILGTRKKLFVTMRTPDGQERHLEAWEGQPLALVEPRNLPRTACDVLEGGKRLLAWAAGNYRATREDGSAVTCRAQTPQSLAIDGPWALTFPEGWGAPNKPVQVKTLMSWTQLPLSEEARAFSGTATYATEFTLSSTNDGARVELDLGRVEVMAAVRLNGERAGCVWTRPYRLDITRLIRPGVNRLTVEVTNTWFNRLAYDAGLDEAARKTWTIHGPGKGAPLKPAGLLGPVVVRVGQVLALANKTNE